jgi:hypothetical protein
MDFALIERLAAAHGLHLRGGFHPTADDRVPPLADGRTPAALVLVGNVGSSLWPVFSRSGEALDGAAHPLNRWTQRVIGGIAREVGATPLFPFGGPPYLPFQRWAMKAEAVAPSPLGILIHPDYGLWHAYRGALAFAERLALPPRVERPRPCDSCADRPCLSACPVAAFTERGYDVSACIGHIGGAAGEPCMAGGCLARRACPVGPAHGYGAAQAHFHMTAFLAARRDG